MFVMPIVLAVLITALQASVFDVVNKNKIPLFVCNKDSGQAAKQLVVSLQKSGHFIVIKSTENLNESQIAQKMNETDALIALCIPSQFSEKIKNKAAEISAKALTNFGIKDEAGALNKENNVSDKNLFFYYHPALQTSYRQSIEGGIYAAVQLIETKQILSALYTSLNEKPLPQDLEQEITSQQLKINEIPLSKDGGHLIPNATQHNIPAWTLFAMFFIVTSLGSNLVKEKVSGSFTRLKTLPTHYGLILLSKQITYLCVCLLQVLVIFLIGLFLFPIMGLPKLNIPTNLFALGLVSILCAWCAISYAQCVGTWARSQEQANGFGSLSVVILAAIGGILIPYFAMPQGFQYAAYISPMFWCLKAYYNLFLETAQWHDVLKNSLPIILISAALQAVSLWRWKS